MKRWVVLPVAGLSGAAVATGDPQEEAEVDSVAVDEVDPHEAPLLRYSTFVIFTDCHTCNTASVSAFHCIALSSAWI